MLFPFQWTELQLLSFCFVLLRISCFVLAWPIFGSPLIANPIKVLFAMALAMFVFPTLGSPIELAAIPSSSLFLTIVMKEVIVGLVLGFSARLFFFAVSMGGTFISMNMGLNASQVFNPSLGIETQSLEQFLTIVATLFYFSIQGHHILILNMVQSFEVLPIVATNLSFVDFRHWGEVLQQTIIIGIKISAPVVVAVFFLNVAMAILGRAVPQINVLITSIPVNILGGFLVLLISMPLMIWSFREFIGISAEHIFKLLRSM